MTELTFEQFLQTASPDAHTARQQARDYQPMPYLWRIQGEVRKTQVETAMIIHDTEARLKNLLQSDADEASKFVATRILRALSRLYEVEFYINIADPEVSDLFSQAQTFGVLNADEMSRITAAALYEPGKPWPNATLHDVLLARNECPTKPLDEQSGYLLPTLTQDTERHQARIIGTNPRTNQPQILGRVNLAAAGVYEFKIPTHYLQHTDFRIDDAYGAIE